MSFCRPSDHIQLLALPSEGRGSTASDTSSIPLQRDQGWHHEPSRSLEKFLEPWLPRGRQEALISEAALQADLCSEGAHLTVLMFPLLSACRVFRPGRRESAQWCCQQGSAALCHPAKVSGFPAQQSSRGELHVARHPLHSRSLSGEQWHGPGEKVGQ